MKDTLDLDWSRHFSRRASLMKSNSLRELVKVSNRPEIISFAGGLPATDLFPIERVKSAVASVLDSVGGQALQYSSTEGLPGLREWLAKKFSTKQMRIDNENVLITSGAQQAMDLIGRVLLDERDRVVVENPTYLALISAWRPNGVQFLPVECDADGMRVDECGPLLRQKPKAIYCVPNFQNPQGTTLSLPRRKKLVALARRHSTVIVEDDPYGELRFTGRRLPSLFELDARNRGKSGLESRVIYAGTFSKVLMPGLRVGWVIAARAMIEKLIHAKQAADLHTSTFNQYLALELVNGGFLKKQLPLLRENYRMRRDVMIDALKKDFPKSAGWTQPEGGMFLWVTAPKNIDTGRLLPSALEKGVAYVPGEAFYLDSGRKNTMRLNFSNPKPERIKKGIGILGQLLRTAAFQQ